MLKHTLIGLLAIGTLVYASQCPLDVPKRGPDLIHSAQGWRLEIWVTAPGTRSEGKIGRLFHDGVEVCPRPNQTSIETPLGPMEFKTNTMPWGWHGWMPKERRKLLFKP